MLHGRGQLKVYDLGFRDKLQLLTTESHEVKIDSAPFASGGCRDAFHCRFRDSNGQWGPKMVAKKYMRSEAFLEDYICAHYAHECAVRFNERRPPKRVDYLVPNQILTLRDVNYSIERFLEGINYFACTLGSRIVHLRTALGPAHKATSLHWVIVMGLSWADVWGTYGSPVSFQIEKSLRQTNVLRHGVLSVKAFVHSRCSNTSLSRMLLGDWVKHNNIFGMILSNRRTPDAFSHFSYLYSNRRFIILDVQGAHPSCVRRGTEPLGLCGVVILGKVSERNTVQHTVSRTFMHSSFGFAITL